MKMEKPMVEAVRFNSADVIATSGGGAPLPDGASPLGNNYYNSLRSEANEAGLTYTVSDTDDEFVYFQYNAKTKTALNPRTINAMASGYCYAWFQNGQWWTENKGIQEYGKNPTSTVGWWTGD